MKDIIEIFFKDDKEQPFRITEGQEKIVEQILVKKHNRVQIIAPTQYGKSNTVAMAIVLRAFWKGEQWAIIAGSQPKADVIMQAVIQHIFDNECFKLELDIDSTVPLETLKRERSKKRITFKNGGEIRTYSGDARNKQRVKEALMGYGCPNIVEDESCLIEDDLHSTVMRMLGGHKGGFLLKIGNPTYKQRPYSHFNKSWNNSRYEKIFIDYNQAIKEGRYTKEFIEEMRHEMSPEFFRIYYECNFPEEDEIDIKGYFMLLKDNELKEAIKDGKHEGELRLGYDVGEGHDSNVAVLRSNNYAEVVHESRTKDLMYNIKIIRELIKKYDIKPNNIYIDSIGVGAGVYSRLLELDINIRGIKWSEKSQEDETKQYKNLKAQNFGELAKWIRKGGTLKPHDGWEEIKDIKWKEDTDGKVKIKSKEEMRREGIPSPNIADALALTFNKSIIEEAPEIHMI